VSPRRFPPPALSGGLTNCLQDRERSSQATGGGRGDHAICVAEAPARRTCSPTTARPLPLPANQAEVRRRQRRTPTHGRARMTVSASTTVTCGCTPGRRVGHATDLRVEDTAGSQPRDQVKHQFQDRRPTLSPCWARNWWATTGIGECSWCATPQLAGTDAHWSAPASWLDLKSQGC
jgi:hypothetical protein